MAYDLSSPSAHPINEMKCPFRVDRNGEFMPCCGDKCMAYLDYENHPWTLHGPADLPPVFVRQCRRLAPGPVTYGCGI